MLHTFRVLLTALPVSFFFLLLLTAKTQSANAGFSQEQHKRAAAIRKSAFSGPPPRNLLSAKQLHQHLLGKARTIERLYGHKSTSFATNQPRITSGAEPIITPVQFGGDPTGKTDSTEALQASVRALLASGSGRAGGHMASGITDLGGATIDLGGGLYNISAPLVFPQLVGNFQLTRGSLRASPSFPSGRFLIEVGNSS